MGKVYINGREAVHKGCGGRAIAFPDVCLCPPGPPAGPVPVPLTNTVQAKDLVNGAMTVLFEGNPAGHRDSYFDSSTGNEVSRSTGGGIVSHAVQGKAYFASWSPNVFIEGKPAVRHGDLLTQNHLGKLPANTPPSVWMSSVNPDSPMPIPKKYTKTLAEGDEEIHALLVDLEGNVLVYEPYSLTTPAGAVVEARTLLDGGIHVRKVKRGRCKLVLPNRDSQDLQSQRTQSKAGGQNVRYRPGTPLMLETGKTHQVEVPTRRSFWLHVNVQPRDPAAQDDKFILRSADRSLEIIRTVKDNRKPGAAGLTLEFPNLRSGLTYRLIHDTGAEGEVITLFDGLSYDDLFRTESPETD